jgi:uncharacterized protein YecE (DUF72 family)
MATRGRTQAPQLGLFASEHTLTARERDERDAIERERARWSATAAEIPRSIRFGTSSWSFPGWRGIVYPHARTTSQLARDGLAEYAKHPLLRTVGIDRGYYAPIPRDDLARYAEQTPDDFVFCAKAPESVVSPVVSAHRDKHRAGERNEDFLSAPRFAEEMLLPMIDALGSKLGPLLIEFPPVAPQVKLRGDEFAEALDDFLAELPAGLQYSVELRDRQWFTPMYRAVLRRRGAAHVYNYWSYVPTPGAQRALVPAEEQPFIVSRLLLRPGSRYEAQREAFAPFDAVVEQDDGMRDEVTELLLTAARRDVPAYVIVNNKAEGCSPKTVTALAERLVAGLREGDR